MIQQSPIYEGQFGTFTIDQSDRLEVIIYRIGLAIASVSFCIGTILMLSQGLTTNAMAILTPLFYVFILGLGASLQTIHIYLKPLHNALKIFWLIGLVSTIFFSLQTSDYLIVYVMNNPLSLFGIGCVFASLTGVLIKEAFCFNRLEAKFLSFIIPTFLLGYMLNLLSIEIQQFLLTSWCCLFLIYILSKYNREIPRNIRDKMVFA